MEYTWGYIGIMEKKMETIILCKVISKGYTLCPRKIASACSGKNKTTIVISMLAFHWGSMQRLLSLPRHIVLGVGAGLHT